MSLVGCSTMLSATAAGVGVMPLVSAGSAYGEPGAAVSVPLVLITKASIWPTGAWLARAPSKNSVPNRNFWSRETYAIDGELPIGVVVLDCSRSLLVSKA